MTASNHGTMANSEGVHPENIQRHSLEQKIADSVAFDAVKPGVRLRTQNRLETCQTMLVECGNQGGDEKVMSTDYRPNFIAYECWKVERDFDPAMPEPHRRPLIYSLVDGGCR